MSKKHKHRHASMFSTADLRPRIERARQRGALSTGARADQAVAQVRTDAGQPRLAQGDLSRPRPPTPHPGTDARRRKRSRCGVAPGWHVAGVAGAVGRGNGPVRRNRADAGPPRTTAGARAGQSHPDPHRRCRRAAGSRRTRRPANGAASGFRSRRPRLPASRVRTGRGGARDAARHQPAFAVSRMETAAARLAGVLAKRRRAAPWRTGNG